MPKLGVQSSVMESAVGFALGAVGGCILGATEDPVYRTLSLMTAAGPLKPVMEEARTVGPLGLGALMAATALTASMTSVVAGVILAAVVASVGVATRSCWAAHPHSVGLWALAGLAGAFGTTLSGATLGTQIEWIVQSYGMVGMLWALSVFTALKPLLRSLFMLLWKQTDGCCTLGSEVWTRQKETLQTSELQQRQRVTVQIEQRILALEGGVGVFGEDQRTAWATERQEREELERRRMQSEEAEMEHRSLQDWINMTLLKYLDFLAFSGIPMTVIAIVTSVFGLSGYGGHQSVFLVLLALVGVMALFLLKYSDFKFWMLVACLGMFASFVVAMLTLHAGQEVVTASARMRVAGQNLSRENITARMDQHASLEALSAAFFGAKLCQLGLGATVGGGLVRRAAGEVKVTVGTALIAAGLLGGVQLLAPVLGEGGGAGALLGVVGVAGASVGGAAAAAGRSSSRLGALGTLGGLVMGALVFGRWNFVNIGLQLPVAFVFAMTNPL